MTPELQETRPIWRLRTLFNIRLGMGNDYNGQLEYGGSYIKVQKKGRITNYPWQIGEIDTILHVPECHSTSQASYGDIWMTFDETRITWNDDNGSVSKKLRPYYNFYLSTWNNTAMIQTGHSSGAATAAEQKVLANTLFYLKQLTREKFAIDHSAQDLAAPDKVTEGYFSDSFNFTPPKDNGSTYHYYVENLSNKVKSNNMSATITTGVAGYAYVIDNNPWTTNVPTTVMTNKESIYLVGIPNVNGKWLHIRTIDRAGNYSGVAHFKIKLGYSDLALRQFISGVERDGTKYTVNRAPNINTSPIINGGTTAIYNHTKWPEWVKRNDIITYTIRIYNEGTFKSYADAVNVYLPSGLEFIYSNVNRAYGWSISGTNQITSNFLMNTGINGYVYYDSYGNKCYHDKMSYAELKLECKVSANSGPYTVLTSLAEVARFHAVDEKGVTITRIEDKDSSPDNLSVPNDTDKPNYNRNQQDDDDFEKVQIMYTDVYGNVWVDKEDRQPKVQHMLVKLTDLTDGSTGITRTNGEGEYIFKNLRVDHIYTIEYEYDGQTYTKSNKTASYANENSQDRENLNKRFYEITEAGARNRDNVNSIVTFDYNTRKRSIAE